MAFPQQICTMLTKIDLQSPENFDFEITRAINSPHHHVKHHTDEEEKHGNMDDPEKTAAQDGDQDVKVSETSSAEGSPRDDEAIGVTEDAELDPVALKKAFKFAAWSSVVLVSASVASSLRLQTYNVTP